MHVKRDGLDNIKIILYDVICGVLRKAEMFTLQE